MKVISLLLPQLAFGNTTCLFANAFGALQGHVLSLRRISQFSAAASASMTSTVNVSKYNDLIQWFLSSSDKSYLSPKVEFRPSTRGGLLTGGYGTFVNDDLVEGELLLRIPRNCCVTLDDALSDLECGPAFQKLLERFGPGSDTVVLAGYLAKEYLLLKEYDRRLQNGEMPYDDTPEMKRLSSIKFAPYLRTLPWERGVNAQEHVLFWEDEDVESLLKGSLAYDDAIEIRSTVKMAIKILEEVIGPVIRIARGERVEDEDTWFRFPWQQSKEESEAPSGEMKALLPGLEDAVKGAFVISLSRAFVAPSSAGDGKQEDRLEPVFDMLQHSNTPNIRHVFCDDGSIEVKAGLNIQFGEELFNQYKGEDKSDSMPYHKFFTRFGFVPGVTEPVAKLIAERSTIFFPQRATV